MKTPVHVVAGFLGAGKTTVLLAQLAAREGRERCAVVVNDFGEARIDATLLGGGVAVTDIAGGCVCCTAPEGLAPAIGAILEELRPDRVFVEPSGLARPRDVVDMLSRGGLRERVELGPTVVLVDPTALLGDVPPVLREQLEGADVLVATRVDLASREAMAAFHALAEGLWPRPLLVAEAVHGAVPDAAWTWPDGAGPRAAGEAHDHAHASTDGYRARSWVFPPEAVFGWDALKRLVAGAPGLVRFKGVFRTDLGWFRLDRAGGAIVPALTAYRRDSRADAIVDGGGDPDALDAALREARVRDGDALFGDEAAIELADTAGLVFPLTRGVLMALPGQVADVAAVVPGREGSAVYLREVLALAGGGARYVVAARDGMTTEPADVAGVGDALLVHSRDGRPLPDDQGGPFRLLAPKGASNCASVKGVARVRVLA